MFESAELVEFYIYFLTFLLILISDRTNIFYSLMLNNSVHNFAMVTHTRVCV